ncbi:hypothetical protein KSP39_PZI009757 [Platanthera zijinensis]|uniref:Uncharacterized protein n=1 Tax=Platanthera zijinensis TaxID=2320716 RepID=A0AAP0BJ00_9ASPA
MTSQTNGRMKRPEEPKHVKQIGPNWVLILGGALLSTLSIRLCCKLKKVFDFKGSRRPYAPSKENGKPTHNMRHQSCKLHSQMYCSIPDEDACHQCLLGARHIPTSPISKDGDYSLPLVKVASPQSVRDSFELPLKPFNHPNSSDSPCVSESGSDIYSKREVIQKLRHQLRRRDDMLLEVQAQIISLQNSLSIQTGHTTHLQAQLDSSNRELLDSEQEIKWLQKTISDMRSGERVPHENPLCAATIWLPEAANGHPNGLLHGCVGTEKSRGEERIEMLKRQVKELKEVIESKDLLIQSYKEQKIELCSNLTELQLRIVSQSSVPNIL